MFKELGKLSDYFIYAYAETGYFARISDRILADPNLIQVDSMPPNVDYKWDGTNWVNLTVTEIEEKNQVTEPLPEIETVQLQTNTTTLPNSLVLWGSSTGDRLINSGVVLQEKTLQVPYDLNLINQKYLVNGIDINDKDRQKIIKVTQENYSGDDWQLIPDMRLTSLNLEPSLYKIEIELLLKVSKSNSELEVGLFINDNQLIENSLHLDFSQANDDKLVAWGDEILLTPYSLIEVYWRNSGRKNTCYVERRKLLISEK